MKKLTSNLKNMALVLTGISIVSGGLLAYVNGMTAEKIARLQEERLQQGITQVLGNPGLKIVKKDSVTDEKTKKLHFIVYSTADKKGNRGGTAIAATENGFGGPLTVLVGFTDEGNVSGYTILQTTETAGLGLKAEDWFRKGKGNIIGRNPGEASFAVTKDGGTVDAITASTITSRAFLKAVTLAYQQLKQGKTDAHSGASSLKKKAEAAPVEATKVETPAPSNEEMEEKSEETHKEKKHKEKKEKKHKDKKSKKEETSSDEEVEEHHEGHADGKTGASQLEKKE